MAPIAQRRVRGQLRAIFVGVVIVKKLAIREGRMVIEQHGQPCLPAKRARTNFWVLWCSLSGWMPVPEIPGAHRHASPGWGSMSWSRPQANEAFQRRAHQVAPGPMVSQGPA